MAEQKIVIVCGGRDYNDRATVYKVLDEFGPDVLVHGACRVDKDRPVWHRMQGLDRLADDWCMLSSRPSELVRRPASWTRLGKAAGPIRNRQMAEEFPTATVIAFPGGTGTANMVRIAVEKKMKWHLVTVEGVLL